MEKKMRLKKSAIMALIIILTLIAGVAAFLLISGDDEKDKKEPEVTYVTITFDTDGGSEILSKKVKEGGTITLPESEKEGFVLVGWYNGEEEVSKDTTYDKDTTLIAKWEEAKTFKVTFDSKGGSKVEAIKVICDRKIELPEEPTKEGYTFVNWKDKNEKEISDGDKLACEDITLYANWEKEKAETFRVSFDSKGGSKVSAITVECNKTLSLPKAPTKEGYTFVAWNDINGKAILDGALLACEDVTLYADWKEVEKTTPSITPAVTNTPTPTITPTTAPEVTVTPEESPKVTVTAEPEPTIAPTEAPETQSDTSTEGN